MSKILTKTVTAGRPSLNYLVMQYFINTKKKMPFDPVVALNHFVAPGVVAEPSTIQGLDVEKRMRSRIGYLVESLTDEEESLSGKKRFADYICQANDLRFAGRTKTKTRLFPFSGATFFLSRDGQGVRNEQTGDAREKLRSQLKLQLRKLMDKEKVTPLLDKFIETGEIAELTKGIEILIEIMLKKRIIPYGYNSYLNEVKRMRSLVSANTDSLVAMESVKIRSIYQSAALMAQDICFQLRQSRTSFRAIFSSIVRDLPSAMPCGITGIRVSCSGRLGGAEIARIECGKYGRTSLNVFHQKTDYAFSEVSTRYGILGVKVWILGKYRPSISAAILQQQQHHHQSRSL